MTYTIKDTVEVGVSLAPGGWGSIDISLVFDKVLSEQDKKIALNVLDRLDHSFIARDIEIKQYSERCFVLDKMTNVFDCIIAVLIAEIEHTPLNVAYVNIELNKESCKSPLISDAALIYRY